VVYELPCRFAAEEDELRHAIESLIGEDFTNLAGWLVQRDRNP
jgi:hypothetical protein